MLGTVNVVEETVNVTGIFNGLLLAPEEVICILPFCVPEVSPLVFTETVNVAGVEPLAGDMLSQEPPEVTAALTLTAVPPLIVNV